MPAKCQLEGTFQTAVNAVDFKGVVKRDRKACHIDLGDGENFIAEFPTTDVQALHPGDKVVGSGIMTTNYFQGKSSTRTEWMRLEKAKPTTAAPGK